MFCDWKTLFLICDRQTLLKIEKLVQLPNTCELLDCALFTQWELDIYLKFEEEKKYLLNDNKVNYCDYFETDGQVMLG